MPAKPWVVASVARRGGHHMMPTGAHCALCAGTQGIKEGEGRVIGSEG